MNRHFLILSIALILMTGVGSFITLRHDYKNYRQRFLKSLLNFIFFYNLYITALFSYHYAMKNIYQNDFNAMFQNKMLIRGIITFLLGSMMGYVYNFFKTSLLLRSQPVTGKFKILFSLAGTVPLGVLIYLWVDYPSVQQLQWLTVSLTWMLSMNCGIILLNAVTLIKTRRQPNDSNSVRAFSLIYLAAFLLTLPDILNDAFLRITLPIFTFALSLFLVNSSAIFWFKRYYLRNRSPFAREEPLKSSLDHLCADHKITEREKEIIQLILQGKQNQEIADTLFLSLNTVKTYITRIFKKLKLRNRNELAARILSD